MLIIHRVLSSIIITTIKMHIWVFIAFHRLIITMYFEVDQRLKLAIELLELKPNIF